MKDLKNPWNPYWVIMWGVISAVLLSVVWFIPFKAWTVLAVLLFGIPEWIGIRRQDAYPPLTHVIVRYVPRPITHIALGALVGLICGFWAGLPAIFFVGIGAALALDHWLTDHFDTSYEHTDMVGD